MLFQPRRPKSNALGLCPKTNNYKLPDTNGLLLMRHRKNAVPAHRRLIEQILLAPLPVHPGRSILRPLAENPFKRLLRFLPLSVLVKHPRRREFFYPFQQLRVTRLFFELRSLPQQFVNYHRLQLAFTRITSSSRKRKPAAFTASCVESFTRMCVPYSLLSPSSREDRFTVSPSAVYPYRSSDPMFPTLAVPEFKPIPISSFGLPSASHCFCSACTLCIIASDALHALIA